MSELYEGFSTYFDIRKARTAEEIDESFRLRYRVYCLEKGFERLEDHPDGRERDEYDGRSVHSVLFQNRTGLAVGTVRLVLADREDPSRPFPIEAHCGAGFFPDVDVGSLRRENLAEISRFAVAAEFRRRKGEEATTHGLNDASPLFGPDEDERRAAPHMTIGLFRATLAMSVDEGITHWYAVMEPTLFRLLQRMGVHFRQIGADSEYHGLRRPCLVGIDEMLEIMQRERPEIWAFMTADGDLWRRGDARSAAGI